MNLQGNTIFISGGSAGIGLEMAKLFSAKGNKVIINGRNKERLVEALSQLEGAVAIQGDLSIETERIRVAEELSLHYPELNIIINNAGAVVAHSLSNPGNAYLAAKQEIDTNYTGVIHFTDLLLPHLLKAKKAAIVNVTSIAAWMTFPLNPIPTYPASKAALHFYTHGLRQSLAETNISVFELIPPLVNTEFSAGIGGANGISPNEVAEELWQAFEKNQLDVPVGQSKFIYELIETAAAKLTR